MKIIRVFPRLTTATPDDDLAIVGRGPDMWEEADRVLVSVAFDDDLARGEWLARQWGYVTSDVHVGGPAYDDVGGEFVPGRFIAHGYTITSRGCPNSCWFCHAWKREGHEVRLLPIRDGFNVLDNNLLACPDEHVAAVFDMLERQKERPRFTGGFEAARLRAWHVERLVTLKPKVIWFAYDEPSDWDPLRVAAGLLAEAGLITGAHGIGCYVLCGWKGDTFSEAETRMRQVVGLGVLPQAMLFNRGVHWREAERSLWRGFAREWSNKVIVGAKMRDSQRKDAA